MLTIKKVTQQLKKNQFKSGKINQAAILIPIIAINSELHLLFEVRSSKLKWQPGDICFPGGHIEPQDSSPEFTAKRETIEELGIRYSDIIMLGQLPDFIASLGLHIYPFIGHITSLDTLAINTDEVESIFTVPINWFIHNSPKESSIIIGHKPADSFPFELVGNFSRNWTKRSEYPIYFYQYNDHIIWGLTAQIIIFFINAIQDKKYTSD